VIFQPFSISYDDCLLLRLFFFSMWIEFGSQNAAAIPAHLSRCRPRASARIALRATPEYLIRTYLAFVNPDIHRETKFDPRQHPASLRAAPGQIIDAPTAFEESVNRFPQQADTRSVLRLYQYKFRKILKHPIVLLYEIITSRKNSACNLSTPFAFCKQNISTVKLHSYHLIYIQFKCLPTCAS